MKQHITIEDLYQLSDKAKEKLRDWFYSSIEYDDNQVLMYLPEEESGEGIVYGGNWDQEIRLYDNKTLELRLTQKLKNYEGKMYPLLSIGQIIDLIKKETEGGSYIDDSFDYVLGYEPLSRIDKVGIQIGWIYFEELCDALWEACKYILEDKYEK